MNDKLVSTTTTTTNHAGNAEATQLELTVVRTWLPGLTRRRAASAHR